jgi:hypothetical protein
VDRWPECTEKDCFIDKQDMSLCAYCGKTYIKIAFNFYARIFYFSILLNNVLNIKTTTLEARIYDHKQNIKLSSSNSVEVTALSY